MPGHDSSASQDELTAERQHLAYVRKCLDQNREDAVSTAEAAAQRGDDEKAFWYSRRAWQLDDRDQSPLFFGRLDGPEPEPIYVGRRYVSDPGGTPVTIDWRTDMAARFYRASQAEPMEVVRRRRYGFATDHELTSFDDEVLADLSAEHGLSTLVRQEIERAHFGPMRDIVATIQPDQDHVVRLGADNVVVVQGGPGTGKTAVGLHRAAFLLFAHRRIRQRGVLIVGPNDTFVHYISRVLPALGEIETVHTSLAGLVGTGRTWPEPPEVAALKGDARLARVLARAVRHSVRLPDKDFVVTNTSPYVRLYTEDIQRIATELVNERRPFADSRDLMGKRVASWVRRELEHRGQALSDRETEKISRAKQTRTLTESIWPPIKPRDLLFRLLSDPSYLATCAEGILTSEEQAMLLWTTPPATAGRAKWSDADQVLLDELAAHLSDERRFGHVVVDEAQDLSAMQLRAVARRCTGSATLLGDLPQQTTRWAVPSWQEVLAALELPGEVVRLNTSFRVPAQILDVANRLLKAIAPELPSTTSARSVPHAVTLAPAAAGTTADKIATIVRDLPIEEGSIGIITADPDIETLRNDLVISAVHPVNADEVTREERVALVPASRAKGLEFDHVLVVEPHRITEQAPTGLRLLYIAFTRAISRLTIVHSEPLPAVLGL